MLDLKKFLVLNWRYCLQELHVFFMQAYHLFILCNREEAMVYVRLTETFLIFYNLKTLYSLVICWIIYF